MNSKPSSELEWLLYHLWLKTGPVAPQFIFTLADTIFYRQNTPTNNAFSQPEYVNIPECWYFTSKDGYILKKNRFNVSTKEIHRAFMKKLETYDQVAAVAYYPDNQMQHMPPTEFKVFLFSQNREGNPTPYALQKFIPSKQIKNTIFKVTFKSQQQLPHIEKLQNINSFFDTKVPLDERVSTFEADEQQNLLSAVEANSIPQQIGDNLARCVKQIQSHIMENARVELQGAKLYFKIDRRTDNLILIYAHNLVIKSDSSKVMHQACLGEIPEVKMKVYKAQKRTLYLEPDTKSDSSLFPELTTTGAAKAEKKVNTRPSSNYQTQKSLTMRACCQCPFCEGPLPSAESGIFEITVSQILKLQKFMNQRRKKIADIDLQQSAFCKAVVSESIPQALIRAFPGLERQYEKKKQDPLFLYDSVKLCEECYEVMKEFLLVMKQSKKEKQLSANRDLPMINIKNQRSFPQHQQLQNRYNLHQNESSEFRMSQIPNLSISKVDGLNQSQEYDSSSLKENRHNQSETMNYANTAQKVLIAKYPEIPSRISNQQESYEKIIEEPIRSHALNNQEEVKEEEKQPNTAPAQFTMMFSKVEAGKVVAESLVKIQKNEDDKIEVLEKKEHQSDKCQMERRMTKQSSLERVPEELTQQIQKQQRPQTSKERGNKQQQNLLGSKLKQHSNTKGYNSKNGQYSLLPKIDWEKEYSQAMKSKTKRVKDEILTTCERMERAGQLLSNLDINERDLFKGQPDSLLQRKFQSQKQLSTSPHQNTNLISLNIDQLNNNQVPLVHESRMFENITPIILDVETNQSVLDQKQVTVQQQQQKRSRVQPNNVRQQRPKLALIPPQIPQPISKRKSQERNDEPVDQNQQDNEDKLTSQKRILTAYGVGAFKTKSNFALLPRTRQRPQSSKPPLHVIYNTQTLPTFTKQPTDTDKHVRPFTGKRSNKSQKPQQETTITQNANTAMSTNLLDFNNMTEDNIKQIAEKADQLIEIIQNIKEKVGSGNNTTKQMNNNDIIDVQSQHQERQENGSWW